MAGTFRFPPGEAGQPEEFPGGPAVLARAYARQRLTAAVVFWGGGAALSLLLLGGGLASFFAVPDGGAPLAAAAGGLGLALSLWMGGRAALDLWEAPVPFEGRVAGKAASLFWNRLTFLEDKYHLRLARGADMRPLAAGGRVAEGWFLAARGYHELVNPGDAVRGALHRRTRLIAHLVKP